MAATVIDAVADDRLREAARALLEQWRDAVHAVLVEFGAQQSTARDDASALLAALEGRPDPGPSRPERRATGHLQRFVTSSLS